MGAKPGSLTFILSHSPASDLRLRHTHPPIMRFAKTRDSDGPRPPLFSDKFNWHQELRECRVQTGSADYLSHSTPANGISTSDSSPLARAYQRGGNPADEEMIVLKYEICDT